MQAYFLKILTQKCGRYVCVQLLQTLNILFENIRNETSICEFYSLPILLYMTLLGHKDLRDRHPLLFSLSLVLLSSRVI